MAESDQDLELLREVVAVSGLDVSNVVLPSRKAVLTQGRRINFFESGSPEKPLICFLHGGGLTAHTWDVVCVGLCADYRCVAIDLRGHGDSDWAADGDYSLDAHVADLESLVTTLAFPRFTLVGMSLGGLVAMLYASTYPDRMSSLVIVDVGPRPRREGAGRIRQFMAATATPASLDELIERSAAFNPRRRREVLRRSLLANLRPTADGKWIWKYDPRIHGITPDPDRLWAALSRVDCPTLVIRGSESDVFHDEDAVAVVSALSDGESVKVDGAGHTVQGDQPALFVRELRSFLIRRIGQDSFDPASS